MSRILYPNLSRKFFPATDISAPVSGIAVTVFECILPFFLHTIFTYILGVFESNQLIFIRYSSNSSSKSSLLSLCLVLLYSPRCPFVSSSSSICLVLLSSPLGLLGSAGIFCGHTLAKCPSLPHRLQACPVAGHKSFRCLQPQF